MNQLAAGREVCRRIWLSLASKLPDLESATQTMYLTGMPAGWLPDSCRCRTRPRVDFSIVREFFQRGPAMPRVDLAPLASMDQRRKEKELFSIVYCRSTIWDDNSQGQV